MANENEIPDGFEICPGCQGCGKVVVGIYPATSTEPASEQTVTCEMCEGDEIIRLDSDEDLDIETDSDVFADADTLASAGFGMDEDYGGGIEDCDAFGE